MKISINISSISFHFRALVDALCIRTAGTLSSQDSDAYSQSGVRKPAPEGQTANILGSVSHIWFLSKAALQTLQHPTMVASGFPGTLWVTSMQPKHRQQSAHSNGQPWKSGKPHLEWEDLQEGAAANLPESPYPQ